MRESNERDKVLMICHSYPPIFIAGTWRSLAFSRALPQFDWWPTVITTKATISARGQESIDEVPICRTVELPMRRLADFFQGVTNAFCKLFGRELRRLYYKDLLCFPDEQIWWFSTLTGIRLARTHKVIYASCSPYSSALSACFIKRFTGKPLVLDFRDPWYFDIMPHHTSFYHAGIQWLERFTLAHCDALIVTSKGTEELYRQRYPSIAQKIRYIPNGYDRLNPAIRGSVGAPFRVMHVGNFYGSRTPDPLLEALSQLSGYPIEFVQVGGNHEAFARYRDRVKINLIQHVDRENAMEQMRRASLLYLRQGLTNHIAIAAKSVEYLATGLPILAHCPQGDNSDLIRDYATRSYLVHSDDATELREQILRAYNDRGDLDPRIAPKFIHDFDRRTLTGELARIFEKVCSR